MAGNTGRPGRIQYRRPHPLSGGHLLVEASPRDEGFLAARVLRTHFGAGVIVVPGDTVHGEAVLDTRGVACMLTHWLTMT